MSWVTRFVPCAVGACLFVFGCSSESRREADGAQIGAAAPAVSSANAAVSGGTTSAKSPSASAATSSAVKGASVPVAGQWARVPVTDAKIESKDGKSILTVKVKVPGVGWKLEIRPLVSSDPAVKELEVVGSPPAAPAAQGSEERTVTSPVDLGEKANQPVLVYGSGGAAIFAQ